MHPDNDILQEKRKKKMKTCSKYQEKCVKEIRQEHEMQTEDVLIFSFGIYNNKVRI